MLAQLNINQDQRGYTVSVSTTHQTHAGVLPHFTELLAELHHAAVAAPAASAAIPAAPTPYGP